MKFNSNALKDYYIENLGCGHWQGSKWNHWKQWIYNSNKISDENITCDQCLCQH